MKVRDLIAKVIEDSAKQGHNREDMAKYLVSKLEPHFSEALDQDVDAPEYEEKPAEETATEETPTDEPVPQEEDETNEDNEGRGHRRHGRRR